MQKILNRRILFHFSVFAYFVIAAVFITYPLVFHLTDMVTGYGDELLVSWILSWNIYAWENGINPFDANIFYPYKNTLAYSDVFFTSSVIGYLPYKITNQPAVLFNFNLLFSFATLGFSTYLLTHYLTKSRISGLFTGSLIIFSTYFLFRMAVLQLVSIQYIPFFVLFFILYLHLRKNSYLLASGAFFYLQAMNSLQPALFIMYLAFFFLVHLFIVDRKRFLKAVDRRFIAFWVLVGFLTMPVVFAYFQVSREFGYVRDIRDTIHFANRPEFFFYSSDTSRLSDILSRMQSGIGPYIYEGYLGGVLTVGVIFCLFASYFYRRSLKGIYFYPFFWAGVGAFILSMGPVFQWAGRVIKEPFIIPLPYSIFYYIIPGFKGFRNSSRWEVVFILCFAVAIGILLTKLLRNRPRIQKVFVMVILIFFMWVEFEFPRLTMPIEKKEEFPAVYQYLSLQEKAPLIEIPIYRWNMPNSEREFMREYYSTAHFFPMVNGYSGFSPPEWEKRSEMITLKFPDETTVDYLSEINIEYIIIHADEYDLLHDKKFNGIKSSQEVLNAVRRVESLTLVKRFGDDYLFKLHGAE